MTVFSKILQPFRKLFGLIHDNDMTETYGHNANGQADQGNLSGNIAANLIGGAGGTNAR